MASTLPAGAGLCDAFAQAAASGSLVALVLSRPGPAAGGASRVTFRPVDAGRIAIVRREATRDLTRTVAIADTLAELSRAIDAGAGPPEFAHATLRTHERTLQLLTSRKGRQTLVRGAASPPATAESSSAADAVRAGPRHDRERHRLVPVEAPWLRELGVTDADARVIPAMARKWRQIDKFVEIFDHAWQSGPLAGRDAATVVDFGCGKGYLTFAVHDHLRRLGVDARVIGVELRPELVEAGNRIAAAVGARGLEFVAGDLRSVAPPPMDVTIALHACDTATDHALALGIAGGAALLVASPCCHRELRPQLAAHLSQGSQASESSPGSPDGAALAPLLRHGIHLGQQAEMLTDTLRVLALEEGGYDARVFEFVSLEHTSKNKMILATRRAEPALAAARAATESDALRRFWGIREQSLLRLLRERAAA